MKKKKLTAFVALIACVLLFLISVKGDEKLVVVSLGDSYSAGEGLGDYYGWDAAASVRYKNEDWLAHRSANAWPGQLKFDGSAPLVQQTGSWYFAASTGAKTRHFDNAQKQEINLGGVDSKSEKIQPQRNVFSNIPRGETDYVTLTFGGNDIGFTNILIHAGKTHSSFFQPNEINDRLDEAWRVFDESTQYDLKAMYEEIQMLAGNQAQILVAGYPRLFAEHWDGWFFNAYEVYRINHDVHTFNEKIRAIVEECQNEGLNIVFISVEEKFSGHGAYTWPSILPEEGPYINGVVPLNMATALDQFFPVGSASFHPNEKGARAYAECVQEYLDTHERHRRCYYLFGGSDGIGKYDDKLVLRNAQVGMPEKGYNEPMNLVIDAFTVFDESAETDGFHNYQAGDTGYDWVKRNMDMNNSDSTPGAILGIFDVELSGNHIDRFYASYWWD